MRVEFQSALLHRRVPAETLLKQKGIVPTGQYLTPKQKGCKKIKKYLGY